MPTLALFGVLVARNSFLFSTSMYEQGDSAADSILIQQALRLRLLVGHYSREGFNHPGPAYLYLQAFGQWLTRDVLHIVPTPWNGQFLAVFLFNSVLAAIVVAIVYGWTNSPRGAAAAFAVVCALIAVYPLAGVSGWPPEMFVLTYLVFMLSAASVAARQPRDLWVLALSGWLLVHGYAPFLFVVPLVVMTAAAIGLCWPREDPRPSWRRSWVATGVISAVFALPIVLELILHWPGEFGKYIDYGKSGQAGGHTANQVSSFMLWFWWPRTGSWLVPALCLAVALAVALLARDLLRRYFLSLLVIVVVTTLAFAIYAFSAADYLTNYYIGFFFWSVPFALLLIVTVGVTQAIRARAVTALAIATSVAMVAVLGFVVTLRTDTHDDDPMIPAAVASLVADSHGKTVVLDVQPTAWPQALGLLLRAERTGVRTCVVDPADAYRVVTDEFTCTSEEEASGAWYTVLGPKQPSAGPVARFGTPDSGYATAVAS